MLAFPSVAKFGKVHQTGREEKRILRRICPDGRTGATSHDKRRLGEAVSTILKSVARRSEKCQDGRMRLRPRRREIPSALPDQSWQGRIVSWFGVVLLALNVLAGGSLPARPDITSPTPAALGLFGQQVEICTTRGMVVVGEGGQPTPGSEHRHPRSHFCVFCLPLLHAGSLVPAAFAPAIQPTTSRFEVLVVSRRSQARPGRIITASFPRAPPAAV